jgi:hypothetical protein
MRYQHLIKNVLIAARITTELASGIKLKSIISFQLPVAASMYRGIFCQFAKSAIERKRIASLLFFYL